MVNAGCDWEDAPVVVDGTFISSRTPADLGPWLQAIIRAVGG
jgi:protease I